MNTTEILRISNLKCGYGSTTAAKKPTDTDVTTDVLHAISFNLHEGERLCIIGPNGCGKTTLLRVIAGSLAYRGTVEIKTSDTSADRWKERRAMNTREAARYTGLLPQISAAPWPFTVRETVELGRYAQTRGFFPHTAQNITDRDAVDAAMHACEIADLENHVVTELSGGQLQRVYLARSLAQEPSILLLDEPTNHLDLRHQLELLSYIDTWVAKPRKAVIGVFHDLTLALRFADTIILMEEGRIAEIGPAKDIAHGKAINRVYGMNVAETLHNLLQKW